jgi:hypothetical protein
MVVAEGYPDFTCSGEEMTHDKAEGNDNEPLHSNFFWTDVKEIFYYFT